MDLRTRVTVLSESHDQDGPPGARMLPGDPVGITRVRYPGHGSTRLMRIMQTNACSLSCGYCPTFCGGKVRRTFLSPEEVARVFMDAHRAGLADGLFLTSGVPGRPAKMTDRMLAAVDLLRRREDFQGYVHLKLLPGAEPAQVETAVRLASRVSINLEAPGAAYVRALAREKDFAGDLLPNLELAVRLMLERRREKSPSRFAAVGTTTQFVVGAAGEQDREILDIVTRLERRRQRGESYGSTRPSISSGNTASATTSWSSPTTATCRSTTIRRRRGRSRIPSAFRSRSPARRTRAWCVCPGSARPPLARSSMGGAAR